MILQFMNVQLQSFDLVFRRGSEDAFIKRVVMDLFVVGFVCESTRETNCKNCRDLLASVASQHDLVLAYLLDLLDAKICDIDKLSNYLVQGLPWQGFRPSEDNCQILFKWLRQPIDSAENLTARTIISRDYFFHAPSPDCFIFERKFLQLFTLMRIRIMIFFFVKQKLILKKKKICNQYELGLWISECSSARHDCCYSCRSFPQTQPENYQPGTKIYI